MPSHQRPRYDWPIRLNFTLVGRDPDTLKLPGMEVIVRTNLDRDKGMPVVSLARCCINGLFAN